jgi:hypothetical protein
MEKGRDISEELDRKLEFSNESEESERQFDEESNKSGKSAEDISEEEIEPSEEKADIDTDNDPVEEQQESHASVSESETSSEKENSVIVSDIQQEEKQEIQETSSLEKETDAEISSVNHEAQESNPDSSSSADIFSGIEPEVSARAGTAADETSSETTSNDDKDQDHQEEHEEHHEAVDYSNLNKPQLLKAIEDQLKVNTLKSIDHAMKEIRPVYDEIQESEKQEALKKFQEEGADQADFYYKGDANDTRFEELIRLLKESRSRLFAEMEKNREQNLEAKNLVLEKLRSLVDSEETTTSINALKKIQDEWRSIGPVPPGYVKSMWANYSALIDRFYDQRSIYFELKELDRRKNLEAKNEVVEKAEKLTEVENLNDAIKQLNDLHEEFKHIGPVPKEEQEGLWLKFKTASDRVYSRRKEYLDDLKSQLKQNADKKLELVNQVSEFTDFGSDRITEWNAKTRDILDIQKKWEAIGGIPREQSKQINKAFWSSFKKFFNNKSAFFKELENQRVENLQKKQALLEKAEALKESDDWDTTANTLKELQREWREIGPVPDKQKNEIYKNFKDACDVFFNRLRDRNKETESEFFDNLKRKEEICKQIESMAQSGSTDLDALNDLQDEFNSIGYVPRANIKEIQQRFTAALNKFVGSAEQLDEEEKEDLRMSIQLNKLKGSPNASRKIQRREVALRRKIDTLENDISVWKNNLEFFAESRKADKLKQEFNEKINEAREELSNLKKELRLMREM